MEKYIDFRNISACGENCTKCHKKSEGICGGCIETDGHCLEWKDSQGCPIAICANQQNVSFCGLCINFPCQKLISTVTWNDNCIQELAMQYEEQHEYMVNLIKEADEQYYGSNVSDHIETEYGHLFYAEENPTMHDANHAVINIADDLDKILENVKEFYIGKGLIPRVYLKYRQYETMKEQLIKHGFVVENVGKFEHFLLTDINKIIKTNNLTIKIADNCDYINDRLLDNIGEAYIISEPDTRERFKHSLQRIVKSKDKLYIGYDKSGEPTTVAVLSYTNNGICYIDSVETGKRFQGNGYCRELISKIVDDCDKPLFLSSENPTAIKIYKEAGFTPIKLREDNNYWRAYYKAH